ncbi:MAG: 3-oxoacyl-[acyl-carrier protein] reductase [Thermoleophilaceae bacterium]|nr:3-oxoacyl-[acyl-carrier protein] reductase [Thermoleophilaceae bacterium]
MFDLSGQVALVTGAGSPHGIGFAAARALARQGARVALTATSDRVHERAREIGTGAWAATADLTDAAAADGLVARVVGELGRIDVLVNNAGMVQSGVAPGGGRFAEMSPDAWAREIDINLTTAENVTRAALPGMIERRGGRVIFVSSVTGPLVAIPGESGYATAKAGMDGLMRTLAFETGGDRITVNSVAPGWIETASSPEAEIVAGHHTPVGRPGTPDEVAAAIVFLASPESSYVTGHSLVVDGGNIIQDAKTG